ncbi:MAG TPA: MerR family transcriptional regulator [Methylocella sp.]|nr:MerR family transcriptional regulator [Methylocella sp.]
METGTQHETRLQLGSPPGQDGRPDPQDDGYAKADDPLRLYTIREMARDFQVSIRALRFYEDRGLLHPCREGTRRRYNSRDRLHLRMILKGKSLGFTLTEIRDILADRTEDPRKMELEMSLPLEQITAQIEHLEHQRNQIDEAIRTLRQAQRNLLESPSQRDDRSDEWP